MNYRTICIAGVDGTGKSSTIDEVVRRIGKDKAFIQYMGAKLWETEVARNSIERHKYFFPVSTVMFVYAYIYEMFYRINKHKKSGKIIVYDRYVYEHALLRSSVGTGYSGKIINSILSFAFLKCFPKPDITFYLCCPLEVSLSRKTDINTQQELDNLQRSKNILDDYYKGKNSVIVIDTSHTQQNEVVDIIMNTIQE